MRLIDIGKRGRIDLANDIGNQIRVRPWLGDIYLEFHMRLLIHMPYDDFTRMIRDCCRKCVDFGQVDAGQ